MSKLAWAIENGWQRRGITAVLLYPLALIFGLLTALRRRFYALGIFKSVALPVPVIVIGNITVGGSGKTPLTIALIASLRAAGYQPGVVSRGYGGSQARDTNTPAQVEGTQAAVYGDEAVLIARTTGVPVFVGRDRVLAAQQLLNRHPAINVIVCDDGLQHYALQRTIEIAVFDARGISNGWLLPAGPLREPVARLARVNAVVLNGTTLPPAQLSLLVPSVPVFRMQLHGNEAYRLGNPVERRLLKDLIGLHLLAAAGIGHPQRFFRMLQELGLRVTELPLPDHFDFRDYAFPLGPEIILITEKDAVKCTSMQDARVWVVPVKAELDPRLLEYLNERLKKR
jgi:tetraacyldisaccharide 4'-kinase